MLRGGTLKNDSPDDAVQNANNEAVITLALEDIGRLDELQVRNKQDNATINAYMTSYKNGAEMPPVKVARINGGYFLVDGWHRVAALERLNEYQVEAVVVASTIEEARAYAATANLLHGLPLKKGELRNALKLYIKCKRHKNEYGVLKSYREMEEELGKRIPYSTIRKWIRQDFPALFRAKQKQGDDDPFAKYNGKRGHGRLSVFNLDKTAKGILNNLISVCRAMKNDDELREISDNLREFLSDLEAGSIPLKPAMDATIENDDF